MNNDITPVTLNVLSPIVAPAPFTANFENASAGQTPSNLILNDNSGRVWTVDNSIASGVNWSLGAYEASNKSFRFDFYTIQAGTVSELIMQKVDVSNASNTKLYFNHAYQQYATESDQLEVMVSNDCGQTWTTIWSRAGSNLVTTAVQASTNRLYPRAADWTQNKVLLPGAFQNATELIVKFVATSDYGNALYIDNIWTSADALGVEENTLEDAILFPNPANNNAELSFNVVESGQVTVTVMDMNGRQMSSTTTEASVGAQSMNLDVTNYPAGIYMVQIRQNDNVNTLRLNVTH